MTDYRIDATPQPEPRGILAAARAKGPLPTPVEGLREALSELRELTSRLLALDDSEDVTVDD